MRRCHAEVLLFVSPQVIGFRANNTSSNLDFMAFYEACSSQAFAAMQRHEENQDGGPAEIKIAAFWRFLAVFARKTYGRRQIDLSSD